MKLISLCRGSGGTLEKSIIQNVNLKKMDAPFFAVAAEQMEHADAELELLQSK